MITDCHKCSNGFIGCEPAGQVPCRVDPLRRDIIEMQIHGCPIGIFPPGRCQRCGGDHDDCPIAAEYEKSKALDGECGC